MEPIRWCADSFAAERNGELALYDCERELGHTGAHESRLHQDVHEAELVVNHPIEEEQP